MGDITEIKMLRCQPKKIYKITASAFVIEVKTFSDFTITLVTNIRCKSPFSKYEIVLGDGDIVKSSIRKLSSEKHYFTIQQNILSANEFRRFWITWYGGCIRVGRNDETLASLKRTDMSFDFQYAKFKVQYIATLRIELPPVANVQTFKSFDDGLPEWKEYSNQLPLGAAIGGFDKEPLYIIRAKHGTCLLPGKFVPSERTAYVSYHGMVHIKEKFEVLCGYNFTWVPATISTLPQGAVAGGYFEMASARRVIRNDLFIGRVKHNNYLIPGRVLLYKGCFIPLNGREFVTNYCQFLVTRGSGSISLDDDSGSEGADGSIVNQLAHAILRDNVTNMGHRGVELPPELAALDNF